MPSGYYYAVPPPAWNGQDRLPLLMHLHGYGARATDMLADVDLSAMAARAGVLLILPDGLDGEWSFGGAPTHRRDDVPFLRAVLADAKRRWPVDDRMVVASGFSIGGSMVWELACHAADAFTAFLPVSGGFWEPMPTACDSGPVNLRHVHGLADDVVPMAGRLLFGSFRQGDIRRGFNVWLTENLCTTASDGSTDADGLACESWSTCRTGRALQLCLPGGGHEMNVRWLEDGLAWARSLRR